MSEEKKDSDLCMAYNLFGLSPEELRAQDEAFAKWRKAVMDAAWERAMRDVFEKEKIKKGGVL